MIFESVTNLFDPGNTAVVTTLMILAAFRIYLEIIRFDFSCLPLTKKVIDGFGQRRASSIHKTGLILSVGYILLFAPQILFY